MFSKISISQKILLAFSFFLICLLAINTYSLLEIRKISTIVNQLTAVQFNLWDDCQNLEQATDNAYKGMRKYLLLKKSTYAELVQDNITEARTTIDIILAYPLPADQGKQRLVLAKNIMALHAQFTDMFQLHEADDTTAAAVESLKQHYEQCKETLAQFQLAGYREINQSFIQTSAIATRYEHDLVIFSVLTCLALLMMFFWIHFSIRHSLGKVIKGMEKITQGDFTARIEGLHDQELGKLAIYYNTMAGRLSEVDDIKASFIANLSHEIKTPLTSMRESLSLIAEKIVGPLNDKQVHLIALNLRETDRIIKIVSDLLDISRIRAGVISYTFEPGNLMELLRSRIAAAEPLAVKKNIHISLAAIDPLPPQKYDILRLGQVIDNLLSNAIKFTPEGGAITIKTGTTATFTAEQPLVTASVGQHFIYFSVADTGSGIPTPLLNQIFDRFQQGYQWLPDYHKGSGVGLSIAKFFVEGHHGLIWAENLPAGGCVFHVVLPPQPAAELPEIENTSQVATVNTA
ncbi:MAG: HAMP domain-containing histidine kinase [Deltaproteobacteria bacterium]|nr:HAMP domain-containing histidine kinase [Candidatus Anaeroferrophillus wilburensis]MBN2888822.1 HAMP domain-containing histidine kinase [Deltaproteobacteria bacterium]